MCAIYSQLSLDERKKIERWINANVPVTEMARVLQRHRSTIFREIRRNHFHDADMPKVRGYFALAPHARTTNRRARRWLPRNIDIRQVTEPDLRTLCDRLNATPRKCLGWKTPAEVFRQKMLESRT